MHPSVMIVILNWNGKSFLEECIQSVIDNTQYDNFRVVVVDDNSTDGSQSMVQARYGNWNKLVLFENRGADLGFPGGNNVGLKYAIANNYEYIFLLGNDARVTPDWLSRLLAASEEFGAGIAGPKLIYPDGTTQWAASQQSVAHDCKWVEFSAALIRSDVVKDVGFLDEAFFPASYEDVDYCYRARGAGFRILYVPSVDIIHHKSVTVGRNPNFTDIWERNRIRFSLLNLPLKEMINTRNRAAFELRCLASALLRRDRSFSRVYLSNLRNLPEILPKRRQRLHGRSAVETPRRSRRRGDREQSARMSRDGSSEMDNLINSQ
jgi:GT2 family glycosyltransferase